MLNFFLSCVSYSSFFSTPWTGVKATLLALAGLNALLMKKDHESGFSPLRSSDHCVFHAVIEREKWIEIQEVIDCKKSFTLIEKERVMYCLHHGRANEMLPPWGALAWYHTYEGGEVKFISCHGKTHVFKDEHITPNEGVLFAKLARAMGMYFFNVFSSEAKPAPMIIID